MEKILIKKFCEEYSNRATTGLKEQYIQDNLKVISYIPFITKDALANKLVDISTYKYENYTDDNGQVKRRKTDKIKVNSTIQYLLFCRLVIENYTNLKVETKGFYEEYDMLKSTGLLNKLMVGNDAILPMTDISELRTLIDMKQKDALYNECEIHNYISKQIERISDLTGIMSEPLVKVITEKLNEIPKEELENKIVDFTKNDEFKEV